MKLGRTLNGWQLRSLFRGVDRPLVFGSAELPNVCLNLPVENGKLVRPEFCLELLERGIALMLHES